MCRNTSSSTLDLEKNLIFESDTLLLINKSGIHICFFRIGPLHREKQYEVAAEKPGYVLEKEKEDPLLFSAFKLGEISVQVCTLLNCLNVM